jgi:hypothetical protein
MVSDRDEAGGIRSALLKKKMNGNLDPFVYYRIDCRTGPG